MVWNRQSISVHLHIGPLSVLGEHPAHLTLPLVLGEDSTVRLLLLLCGQLGSILRQALLRVRNGLDEGVDLLLGLLVVFVEDVLVHVLIEFLDLRQLLVDPFGLLGHYVDLSIVGQLLIRREFGHFLLVVRTHLLSQALEVGLQV